MAMLEHDDTLHTRHGIERVMYRGRYGAEAVSYTATQLEIRARAQKCLIGRERSRRIACDTCEPLVTGKSVRRVYRLIDLISSSANDYIKCVFAVAVVLTWSIFPTRPLTYTVHCGPQYWVLTTVGAVSYTHLTLPTIYSV